MPKLYNTVTSNNHKYFTTSNTAIQIKMANIMYDQIYQKIMKKQMSGTVKKLFPPSLFHLNFSVINVFIISISISISISSNYLYPYKQHVSVYIHIYRAHFKYHVSYFLPSLNI